MTSSPAASTGPLMPTLDVDVPDDLKKTAILELFTNDPRPTFILDLQDLKLGVWRPIYSNPACATVLSQSVVVRDDDGSGPFRIWAISEDAVKPPSYRYNGKFWTCFDLHERWRVVGGTRVTFHHESQATAPLSKIKPSRIIKPSTSSPISPPPSSPASVAVPVFLPTSENDNGSWEDSMPASPFISGIFKKVDWSRTSLGPLNSWPYLLRRSARFVLADPTPASLFWGDDEICVFNQGYAAVLAEKGSASLGQPASVVWNEIYENIKPYIAEVRSTRMSCSWKNIQFLIDRGGVLVETYWDWALIPLMEDQNRNSGLYSSIHETTRQFIADRRQESLLASIHARDVATFWEGCLNNFKKNPWDAPLAAFYDVSQSRRLSSSSAGSIDDPRGYYCVLRGLIGVPENHPAFPVSADMKLSTWGIMPFLAEAAAQRESLILTTTTHPTFFAMLEGAEHVGFGIPSTEVVIFCLRLGDEIIGFVVLGLNPRRPYNDDEHRFVDALDSHLSASLSAAALIERARLTELRLQDQLASRISQLEMSDSRYRAITELNPLGTINLTPGGVTVYANKRWFDITGHPQEADISKVDFRRIIHEDDLDYIDREFREMVVNKAQRFYEVRLKSKWFDEVERRWEDRWILCTGGPECDEDGNVVSVIGCITEITTHKHAETIQARHRQAAEEARAAQERYMDVTSHEMRNPLSAILQSADDITSSLKESLSSYDDRITFSRGTIDNCLDAASIISLCAQHQARIINDVLTLSKLDSKLLEVTPVSAQPVSVVRETLHMYAGELTSNGIELEMQVEKSYEQNNIDWVYCDPARLKQILINLMGNAIKFTRTEPTKKITVGLAASVDKPPRSVIHDLEWFPSKKMAEGSRRDLTKDPEWGDGESVYIAVMVSDTGKGLSAEEKKKLFRRFAQANTLTHVHYGGSGLGLFISRELTEMQGGEIGVTSQPGQGSTFAFFIKGRRAASGPIEAHTPSEEKPPENLAPATAVDTTSMPPTKNKGLVPLMPPTSAKPTGPTNTSLEILLVEDNIVNQRVMSKQLIKAGARVAVANHGQEALDYLQKTTLWHDNGGKGDTIDLALVDIEMPVMNGLECARRVRELQREGKIKAHIPLVAVTANARKEQIEDCLTAGMDDYMIKPFRVPDLLKKVEKLMNARGTVKQRSP